MASLWGYIVGSITVLTVLQAQNPLGLGPGINLVVYLVPAALLAIGGGLLISRAYRDAKRR